MWNKIKQWFKKPLVEPDLNQVVPMLKDNTQQEIKVDLNQILAHIEYLMSLTPQCDFSRNLEHVVEELGEVAKAKRNLRHSDSVENRDHLVEETVDLIITSLATFLAAGGKPDQLPEILSRKCAKWESNVNNKAP